jgi:DNA-binding protein HU-beta
VNQAELIAAVAEHQGVSKQTVVDLLGAVAEIAQRSLGNGEEVTLPHLGKLKPVTRAARDARNPRTGETVKVPAKLGVKFTALKDLRDSLPKPRGQK